MNAAFVIALPSEFVIPNIARSSASNAEVLSNSPAFNLAIALITVCTSVVLFTSVCSSLITSLIAFKLTVSDGVAPIFVKSVASTVPATTSSNESTIVCNAAGLLVIFNPSALIASLIAAISSTLNPLVPVIPSVVKSDAVKSELLLASPSLT